MRRTNRGRQIASSFAACVLLSFARRRARAMRRRSTFSSSESSGNAGSAVATGVDRTWNGKSLASRVLSFELEIPDALRRHLKGLDEN